MQSVVLFVMTRILEQNLWDLDFGWSLAGIYVVTDGLEGKEVIDPIAAVFVPHTTQSSSHPHSNRFTLADTSNVCMENMDRSVTLSLPSFRTVENYWTWNWSLDKNRCSIKPGYDIERRGGVVSVATLRRVGRWSRRPRTSRENRCFPLPERPDRLGVSTQPPFQWVPETLVGGKVAGAWIWPLISI